MHRILISAIICLYLVFFDLCMAAITVNSYEYFSLDKYSKIIINLSAPLKYSHVLKKLGDHQVLIITLPNSSIGQDLVLKQKIADQRIDEIDVRRNGNNVVFSIECKQIKSYKIRKYKFSSLLNSFKITIYIDQTDFFEQNTAKYIGKDYQRFIDKDEIDEKPAEKKSQKPGKPEDPFVTNRISTSSPSDSSASLLKNEDNPNATNTLPTIHTFKNIENDPPGGFQKIPERLKLLEHFIKLLGETKPNTTTTPPNPDSFIPSPTEQIDPNLRLLFQPKSSGKLTEKPHTMALFTVQGNVYSLKSRSALTHFLAMILGEKIALLPFGLIEAKSKIEHIPLDTPDNYLTLLGKVSTDHLLTTVIEKTNGYTDIQMKIISRKEKRIDLVATRRTDQTSRSILIGLLHLADTIADFVENKTIVHKPLTSGEIRWVALLSDRPDLWLLSDGDYIGTAPATIAVDPTKSLTITAIASPTDQTIHRITYDSPLERIWLRRDNPRIILSVITDPEHCALTINDRPVGFTPLKNHLLPSGQYLLTLQKQGYREHVEKIELGADQIARDLRFTLDKERQ